VFPAVFRSVSPSGSRPCSARTALRPLTIIGLDAQESPASAWICCSILARLSLSTPLSFAASYFMPSSTELRSSGCSLKSRRASSGPRIEWLLPALHLFGNEATFALLLQLQLGYRCAVDLVWAVGEAQGARGRPEVSQREVVRDTGAAERLDGAI
jgi:hypothetical protein